VSAEQTDFLMSERIAALRRPDGSLSFDKQAASALLSWLALCEREAREQAAHIAELHELLAPVLDATKLKEDT
jgi:hypothetical protein